jgi:hypothetical protein
MLHGLDKNAGLGADVGVRMLGGGLSGITAASLTYQAGLGTDTSGRSGKLLSPWFLKRP